jgi:hypothetical protein
MKYRTLGKTGIRIFELFLGAMTFGDERPEEACNGRSREVPHAGHLCRTRNTPGPLEDRGWRRPSASRSGRSRQKG